MKWEERTYNEMNRNEKNKNKENKNQKKFMRLNRMEQNISF